MPALTTPAQLAAQIKIDFSWIDTANVSDPAQVQISPTAILYWATVAFAILNAQRWTEDGDPNTVIYNLGLEMFVAHHIILEVLAQRDMDMAGVPGVATGQIAGKSAGDVTISYAPQATLELDGSHWNYTVYGQRFLNLARMIGSGPIQVGTPGCSPSGAGFGAPWPGSWPWGP